MRAQGPKEPFTTRSECLSAAANDIGNSRAKSQVVVPTWSLPQPEAAPPKEVNLGSRITMEVDNEYDWLTEEAGFKLVEGPLPVLKRQQ